MQDYQPIPLSDLCNVGADILGERAAPAIGSQTFHGLPFQIGEGSACFLGFGGSINTEAIRVPIAAKPRRVIVAHRLLETHIFEGEPIGKHIANYVFRYADGETVNVPIRRTI